MVLILWLISVSEICKISGFFLVFGQALIIFFIIIKRNLAIPELLEFFSAVTLFVGSCHLTPPGFGPELALLSV